LLGAAGAEGKQEQGERQDRGSLAVFHGVPFHHGWSAAEGKRKIFPDAAQAD
jgi:hypothetical protein